MHAAASTEGEVGEARTGGFRFGRKAVRRLSQQHGERLLARISDLASKAAGPG